MEIIAIDENGLGPILGPLIISAIKLKVKEPVFFYSKITNFQSKIKISDSKSTFRRKEKWTYSKGEIISLSILKVFSFEELLKNYVNLIISDFERDFYIKNYKLPIWAKHIDFSLNLREEINFLDYRAYAIFPNAFNEMLKNAHKFQIDIKFFLDLAYELSNSENNFIMCGKVGGYTYYSKIFKLFGIEEYKVIKESLGHSAYKLSYKNKFFEVHFLMDGDENYYPIAISSIIGKYLREIFMKALNESFGFFEEIPYSSGYAHDYKTKILIDEIKKKFDLDLFIRRK